MVGAVPKTEDAVADEVGAPNMLAVAGAAVVVIEAAGWPKGEDEATEPKVGAEAEEVPEPKTEAGAAEEAGFEPKMPPEPPPPPNG